MDEDDLRALNASKKHKKKKKKKKTSHHTSSQATKDQRQPHQQGQQPDAEASQSLLSPEDAAVTSQSEDVSPAKQPAKVRKSLPGNASAKDTHKATMELSQDMVETANGAGQASDDETQPPAKVYVEDSAPKKSNKSGKAAPDAGEVDLFAGSETLVPDTQDMEEPSSQSAAKVSNNESDGKTAAEAAGKGSSGSKNTAAEADSSSSSAYAKDTLESSINTALPLRITARKSTHIARPRTQGTATSVRNAASHADMAKNAAPPPAARNGATPGSDGSQIRQSESRQKPNKQASKDLAAKAGEKSAPAVAEAADADDDPIDVVGSASADNASKHTQAKSDDAPAGSVTSPTRASPRQKTTYSSRTRGRAAAAASKRNAAAAGSADSEGEGQTTGAATKRAKRATASNKSTAASAASTPAAKKKASKKKAGKKSSTIQEQAMQQLSEMELHSSWKTSSALQQAGLKLKTGPWSEKEVEQLRSNVQAFCKGNPGYGVHKLLEDKSDETKEVRTRFYKEIAEGIERPLHSVYRRVQRMYTVIDSKGGYTNEESAQLFRLCEQHGHKWKVIAQEMGRTPDSVRDHYRSFKNQEHLVQGSWTVDEENMLLELVSQYADASSGKLVTENIPWDAIEAKMETRRASACRLKWTRDLCWRVHLQQQGKSLNWTREDDNKFIQLVYDSGAESLQEVNWERIVEALDARRTKQRLKDRLRYLFALVPANIRNNFEESLEWLKNDKCNAAKYSGRKSKPKLQLDPVKPPKLKLSEDIVVSDSEDETPASSGAVTKTKPSASSTKQKTTTKSAPKAKGGAKSKTKAAAAADSDSDSEEPSISSDSSDDETEAETSKDGKKDVASSEQGKKTANEDERAGQDDSNASTASAQSHEDSPANLGPAQQKQKRKLSKNDNPEEKEDLPADDTEARPKRRRSNPVRRLLGQRGKKASGKK